MYTKVLLAYDGSELSKKAIEEAKNIAIHFPNVAEMHIIAVIEPTGPVTNQMMIDSITSEMSEQMEKQLNEIKNDFGQQDFLVKTSVTTSQMHENPGKSICTYAANNDISLIIIGSRGLGNLSGTLLGSVSKKVLKDAACPVLVIK